jgi:dihydrofolate reductase
MRISLIAALAQNGGIGRDGDLLYHLPADLRHFKLLTGTHALIMGRRTFESLPKGALPNRRNIVLSSQDGYAPAGSECFASLSEALEACRQSEEQEAFIIGGYSVYQAALPLANRLYLTSIEADGVGADVFFPTFDPTEWKTVDMEPHEADERNPYAYTFLTLERTAAL